MSWVIDNGELTNTEFIDLPLKPFMGDSPYTMWRIDNDYNNGMPFSPLFIPLQALNLWFLPSRPLIHVYDSRDTTYTTNGYAIIEPISAEVRQEENGLYQVEFETYADKYNKYTYLKKQAQVKVPLKYHNEIIYQIFRIRQVTRSMDAEGNYRIKAVAQHKFYDLARYMLEDCRPTNISGSGALNWIFHHGWYDEQWQYQEFDYSSNISTTATAYYQNCNVAAALLGVDQCFINRWGGRLYRDNNYFSINTEMEGCKKSGVIQYGYNMHEIEFEEDDSNIITVLIAKDNFGNTVTYRNTDIPTEQIPHHIYGYAYFSYDEEDKELFKRDAKAYFDEHKQSSVNITIRFANLTDLDKYKDFLALDDYEVGDKITVYHKDLDIYYSNLEIISKTFDVVSMKTIEIEVGNFKSAITRRSPLADTVTSGQSASDKQNIAVQNEVFENTTIIMSRNISGMELYPIEEVEKRTIAQLEGN